MSAIFEPPHTCTVEGNDYIDCHYDYTEYDCTLTGGHSGGGSITGGQPTGSDYGSLPPKPIGSGGASGNEGTSNEKNNNLKSLSRALLEKELDTNSFALLGTCPVLEPWKYISSYKIPKSVQNRIDSLKENESKFAKILPYNSWAIQNIKEAKGPVVNLDYFPIVIQKLPKGFATPKSLLIYIRLHMSKFTGTTFAPYDSVEGKIFNSSNPLGSILHIDLKNPSGVNIDDGDVIVSGVKPQAWIVTTIQAPWDYQHPLSGNREWGYKKNTDGTITIYTRGASRLTGTLDDWYNFIAKHSFNVLKKQFEIAEAFWKKFQDRVSNYINSNGGEAFSGGSINMKPNWDQVYNVLFKDSLPSSISCK